MNDERDALGRIVRETWIEWAREQPNPKPSWLVPYDELDESDKEADRRIGSAVAAYAASAFRNRAARAVAPMQYLVDAGRDKMAYTIPVDLAAIIAALPTSPPAPPTR